ncbi:hypothetical protein KFL_000620250 [Klebsormidium nitens]|uniref:Bromo domain-containing protein n=1 Tax=Klebsormidium nitens TaxID=105231 RepID=A0A1Y1HUY9_KLENI|nr:hypothetical protein KFL_000620250 [Klebsormidium nitens]|eukprot:GAQ80791.1 hypothetical protein KFL_000620250 [Klebsormidium nitens]
MASYFRYHNYPGSPPAGAAALSTPEIGLASSPVDQALPRVPRAPSVDELMVATPGEDPSSLCRCTVCRKVFCDPVVCKDCEDSFCEGCLERHCGESAGCGGQVFETVVRNGHLRKVVLSLRVHCPHAMVFNHATDGWELDGAGCPYVGKGTEMQAHQRTCGYRLSSCTRCKTILAERNRSSHAKGCRIRCQLCSGVIFYPNLVPHLQESCPEVARRCPSKRCTFLGNSNDLAQHKQRCALLLPSSKASPNRLPDSSNGETVRRSIQVGQTRPPGEGSTGLDARVQSSKAQPAGDVHTPPGKPVSVARDPLTFHRNVPEAPGTPPSETTTPSASAAAMARTSGPSTGHKSEGNIQRDGRSGGERTEEGGVGRSDAGACELTGSETQTEEADGDSQDTSAESDERREDFNTGQSSAGELSARAETSLHDLLYHPDSWTTLDHSLAGDNGKQLLYALEGLIKQRGPEKLRGEVLETGSQVDRSALAPLHGPTLRLLFLILTGKSDVRGKQVSTEALLGHIYDAFGIIVVSSDIKGSQGGGSKRLRDSEEERSKKHVRSVHGANPSPVSHPPFTYTSRQRQLERNRIIRRILERLEKAECAQDFRDLVSEKVAPGYSKVISRPMSLSTIFNKVAGSDYTVSTLRDDMELIRQNAHTFCKDSFPAIVARADQLMELFTAELEMERGELAQWEG